MKKELTDKQHRELLELGYAGGNRIADLIEFLGDDWFCFLSEYDNNTGFVKMEIESDDIDKLVPDKICNSLWEAVKYKLKDTH